jgi:hypothetical protein
VRWFSGQSRCTEYLDTTGWCFWTPTAVGK